MCSSEYTWSLVAGAQGPSWIRGTCTDPKWENAACPDFCTGLKYKGEYYLATSHDLKPNCRYLIADLDDPSLQACDPRSPDNGTFCCAGDPCANGTNGCLPNKGSLLSFADRNTPFTTISIAESSGHQVLLTSTGASLFTTKGIPSARISGPITTNTSIVSASSTVTLPSVKPSLNQPTPRTSTPATTNVLIQPASSTDVSRHREFIKKSTKAGIGGGLAAGIALLTAAIIFTWWKRHRARAPSFIGVGNQVELPQEHDRESPDSNLRGLGFRPSELSGNRRHSEPYELPSSRVPKQELEAS